VAVVWIGTVIQEGNCPSSFCPSSSCLRWYLTATTRHNTHKPSQLCPLPLLRLYGRWYSHCFLGIRITINEIYSSRLKVCNYNKHRKHNFSAAAQNEVCVCVCVCVVYWINDVVNQELEFSWFVLFSSCSTLVTRRKYDIAQTHVRVIFEPTTRSSIYIWKWNIIENWVQLHAG